MSPGTAISGLLVVDKPGGPTSHDVVDEVRRLYGLKKVGHGGTLDPPATGVLLVGLGKATRLLTFLKNLAKTYEGTVRFGITTTTQDATGEVLEERECRFSADDLGEAASDFVGEIEQIPPMVSAVRVGGERLYEAARRGHEVERKPRKVRVYRFEVEAFDPEALTAQIEVECSSGTYVRTLAEDLGEKLGCGGHLTSLRRLSVGSFSADEARTPADLGSMTPQERVEAVLPPLEAMRDFPQVTAGAEEVEAVSHGRPLPAAIALRSGELPMLAQRARGRHEVPPHLAGMTAGIPVAVVDEGGTLLAVYRRTARELKPAVVLEPR